MLTFLNFDNHHLAPFRSMSVRRWRRPALPRVSSARATLQLKVLGPGRWRTPGLVSNNDTERFW
jgi:hypothetical protein